MILTGQWRGLGPRRPAYPLLAAVLLIACRGGGDASASAQSDCTQRVSRAQQARSDSLFVDARGHLASCPDAMAEALAARWQDTRNRPDYVHQLRAISSAVHDQRLATAVEAVARDPAFSDEVRVEALSTLSYYLRPGRWLEFTFLKDPPDSASLRMLAGDVDAAESWTGSRPLAAGYGDALKALLDTLRQRDTSAVVRHAARRFLQVFEPLRQPPAPAPPAPPAAPQ